MVLVGAGLGTYFGTSGSSKSGSASPIQQTTETVSVTTGTIKQSVSASGTLEPGEDDNLNFEVSGQVKTIDVASGQVVKKGQALAALDTTALSDEVASASSALTAAQDKLTTDTDDSAPTSQIDSDESSVNSAKNSLTSAQADLADATLTSPISGTVASMNLTTGQEVSGSGSGSTGSSFGGSASSSASASSSSSSSSSGQITVINTGSFTVSASVNDTEIGGIKAGDQAVITPSSSSSTIYGVVASVGLIANDSSDVATFPVTIDVTGTPTGVYAGSTVNVSIITEQLNNVTEVPTAAISYANGSAQVTEVTGSGKKTVNITTGAVANGETQVTSGLQPGDKVQETVVRFNRPAAGGGATRSLLGGGGRGGAGGGLGGGGAGGFAGGGRFGGGFGGAGGGGAGGGGGFGGGGFGGGGGGFGG